jgi:hypothetical protein
MVLLAALCARGSAAAVLAGQVNGGVPVKVSPDGKFQVPLTPVPVTPIPGGPLALELGMLRSIYANYTFRVGPASAGSFDVLQYDAFALNTRGGADFSVLYDDGLAAPRTDYNWVQFGYPRSKDSKPFVDSLVFGSPFYDSLSPNRLPRARTPTVFFGNAIWLDNKNYPRQNIQNPAGGGKVPAGDLLLVDEPHCSYTCLKDDIASSLIFDTYLVTFTAPEFKNGKLVRKGIVTLDDGFSWGVKIEALGKPPVPEPASLWLLVAGLAGMGGCMRRRQVRLIVAGRLRIPSPD